MRNDLLNLNQCVYKLSFIVSYKERKYICLICINPKGRCKDDKLWFIIDLQVNFLLSVSAEIPFIMLKYNYIFKDLKFSSYLTLINSIIYICFPFEAWYNIHLVLYNIQGAFPTLFNLISRRTSVVINFQIRKTWLGANNYSNEAWKVHARERAKSYLCLLTLIPISHLEKQDSSSKQLCLHLCNTV